MPKLNMAVIKIMNMLNNLFISGVGSSTCMCVLKYSMYVHISTVTTVMVLILSLLPSEILVLKHKNTVLGFGIVTLFYHDLLKYYVQL